METSTPLTLRYGPDPDQVGDLWLPAGSGPHPVAVVIHGGYWRAYYRRDLMDGLAADLAARGWAAWNIEYRRVGADGGWPQTFRDVACAIDLLDLLADRHGLDRARIAAIGHSAGGQLGLWAAARPQLPADAPGADPIVVPTTVVSLAGVADLRLAEELEQGIHASAELLGGTPEQVPGRYGLASPRELLPLSVRQIVVHGDADVHVDPVISARYVEAARAAGDPVESLRPAEADHFTLIDPTSAVWGETMALLGG